MEKKLTIKSTKNENSEIYFLILGVIQTFLAMCVFIFKFYNDFKYNFFDEIGMFGFIICSFGFFYFLIKLLIQDY